VMVLVSHRPDYRPTWRTSAALTQITLRPLLDDEVIQITRSLAGGALPTELEKRILAKADGSPFFAEEITRSLAEEGYLAREDGHTRVTRPIDEILIPGSVREVIAARLDRLGAAAKRVAQLAAVFGRQFRRTDLAQLLASDSVELDRELAELSRRGVIHRKSLFSDDEYRFGESLTQEVAYDSLLLKQRRQLHERVAALLEQGGGDPTLARPSLIAHHYALSENRAKAVETLLRAAADAERLPSFRTALELFRQAWEISEAALRERDGGDPRFPRWTMEATLGYARMTVLYGASADADAERAAVRGRELALQLGDVGAAATLRTMHGMLLGSVPERFAEGIAIAELAIEDARATGDEVHVLSSSRALVWHYMVDGRFTEALGLVDWLLAELERHGHRADSKSDLYLATCWMRDGIHSYRDDFDTAMRLASETHALAVQVPNRTVESGSAATIAQIEFGRANYDQARLWAERSLATAEAIGSSAGVHRGLALSLAARVALGETVNMSRYSDAIETALSQGGNALLTVHVIVEALLTLGDVTRAERLARIAEARAAGRLRVLFSALALGDATVRRPAQWAEADRSLARALALADAIGMRSSRALVLIARGRLAAARGEVEAARSDWRTARELAAALGMARYERIAAGLLAQLGGDDDVVATKASRAPTAVAVSD